MLEKHVNIQLPSRTKHQEFPKIIYNNDISESDVENEDITETKNSRIIYND